VPLELGALGNEIEGLVELVAARERTPWLQRARELLRHVDPEQLKTRLQDRSERLPWLAAVPLGTMDGTFATAAAPIDHTVVGADGSSISPDRHSPAQYYVINTGHAVLTYGRRPHADLGSSTQLYYRDEDMYVEPLTGSFPIQGPRLSVKMSVAELQALWEASQGPKSPAVALRDGSLILWTLQSEDGRVQEHFLEPFLGYLDHFRDAGTPVASYISYPGARDVVNALRVWLCQSQPTDCANCPSPELKEFCQALMGVLDRQLFAFLETGQRSDVFESSSAILDRYGNHRIQFFYLEVGGEVVRMEAPQWVVASSEMLGLVQAIAYDQCRRSGLHPPYPPALQEAHEQAVITTTDRLVVEQLVERALARKGIAYTRSAKDGSKRRPAV
jgi:hypothetical protein